jgi:hypothetical protein
MAILSCKALKISNYTYPITVNKPDFYRMGKSKMNEIGLISFIFYKKKRFQMNESVSKYLSKGLFEINFSHTQTLWRNF